MRTDRNTVVRDLGDHDGDGFVLRTSILLPQVGRPQVRLEIDGGSHRHSVDLCEADLVALQGLVGRARLDLATALHTGNGDA